MIRERVINTRRATHLRASLALAVLALIASSALLLPSQADGQGAQDGQALFQKRCSGCHALDADPEGPRLRGVAGRMAGTVKTFKYAAALQGAPFTWDEAKLERCLADTVAVVPAHGLARRVPKREEEA